MELRERKREREMTMIYYCSNSLAASSMAVKNSDMPLPVRADTPTT